MILVFFCISIFYFSLIFNHFQVQSFLVISTLC
nr:MAG TPA: hypothetical protein [Bacteriophage sp.]